MKLPGVSRLVKLKTTASTQTIARRLAEEGAPDGTLVWALRQTAGRGRLGRRWCSEPGGLYVSWLLRPRFPPARLADFALACGAAAAAALGETAGIKTTVKPPNDVLAFCPDGRRRKLCGILCEAAGASDSLDWLAVGIGVNVDNAPPLERSTSLRALTGRRWALSAVLGALMKRMAVLRQAADCI